MPFPPGVDESGTLRFYTAAYNLRLTFRNTITKCVNTTMIKHREDKVPAEIRTQNLLAGRRQAPPAAR